jgi:hypothetical protein
MVATHGTPWPKNRIAEESLERLAFDCSLLRGTGIARWFINLSAIGQACRRDNNNHPLLCSPF